MHRSSTYRVDARLAAQAARTGGVKLAGERRIGRGHSGGEGHVEHIKGVQAFHRRPGAVPRGREVVTRGNDALGDEKPGGKLDIVARCAHRDREGTAAYPDLEGFLGGEDVVSRRP